MQSPLPFYRPILLVLILAAFLPITAFADSTKADDAPILYYRTECLSTPGTGYWFYQVLCEVDYRN